mgnify:CR=1 FL=1
MSKITIEAIDQVMERVPGATYAEVREALIKSDGDVIDAIILLQENSTEKENKNKKTFEEVFGKDSDKIKEEITELLRKSNVIRIVIEKNGKIIMNIPITVGVVGVVFAPILTLIGLSASVLAKYRIKIDVHKMESLRYNAERVLNSQEIILEKKNKKGILKKTNVKPSIKEYYFDEDALFITLKAGQGEDIPSLRADDLMKIIMPDDICDIKRTEFYDRNNVCIRWERKVYLWTAKKKRL